MVHSSLSSIGHVKGGAETVVDALLETLGPSGTLVVPTFTFPAANDPNFIFDPLNTPSAMGSISETARKFTGSCRSIHTRHSIAAIGPLAETITTCGSGSAWDTDSPMAQILTRNGKILLLGVPYQNLTLMHLFEVEFGVLYRQTLTVQRRLRGPDGSLTPLTSRVHPPVDWKDLEYDFDRIGQQLEDEGNVVLGEVGNAIARLFYGQDARATARSLYSVDPTAFFKTDGKTTPLTYGHTISLSSGDICVVDPARVYSAV